MNNPALINIPIGQKSFVGKPSKVNLDKPLLADLADYVSRLFEIDIADLLSKSRLAEFVPKRQFFCKLAYYFGYSMNSIAEFLNCDRTAIIYSLKQINQLLDSDKSLDYKFDLAIKAFDNSYEIKNIPKPPKKERFINKPSLDEIAEAIIKFYNKSKNDLFSNRRWYNNQYLIKMFFKISVYFKYKHLDISKYLHCSERTIPKYLKEIDNDINSNPEINKNFLQILKILNPSSEIDKIPLPNTAIIDFQNKIDSINSDIYFLSNEINKSNANIYYLSNRIEKIEGKINALSKMLE